MFATTRVLAWASAFAVSTAFASACTLALVGALWLLVARVRADRRRLAEKGEQAREALARAEESERRFRVLAENAPDVVYRLRLAPAPALEYVSPSTTRILGYTPEEHYADPELVWRTILPEDRPKLEQGIRDRTALTLLRWRRRDGRIVWAEHRNVVLTDESGAPVAIEGIARDVTERIEMEAERERLLCEREDLLRAVSHDFRTPLQAVLLRAETLARDPADAERTARAARGIAESARRMGAALGDVLQLARLSPNGLRPRAQPIAVRPFVEDLTQRLFTDPDLARLRVVVEPDAAVRADPAHLERILTNLIGNALKYSDAPAMIRVGMEAAGTERVVVVADEGPGIAPEDLPRVFERYFRGRQPAGREGTGLGLYVTRILAEAQGGAVSVESTPGKGAVFRVRLPAA